MGSALAEASLMKLKMQPAANKLANKLGELISLAFGFGGGGGENTPHLDCAGSPQLKSSRIGLLNQPLCGRGTRSAGTISGGIVNTVKLGRVTPCWYLQGGRKK